MTYDFNKLLRPSKRRVPKERHLYLLSLDFASALCGLKHVGYSEQNLAWAKYVAGELERAASLYYKAALEEARRAPRRGRPPHWADIAFIYAMGFLWQRALGWPLRFRKYQNARITKGERGGTERPTTFQHICNEWMGLVDPDRPKPLAPAAFKDASQRLKRLSK
jgi:hypothetical protein